jgi:hypothetical protein
MIERSVFQLLIAQAVRAAENESQLLGRVTRSVVDEYNATMAKIDHGKGAFMNYAEGDRVTFDGWDYYPPVGATGTVLYVATLREPEHPFAAPICVRWDIGGDGYYSATMLAPATETRERRK